jgi:hypothetical protein
MRGQITLEYIVVMGIASIIFLITINFIMHEKKVMSESVWSIDGQDRVQELASAINSVYLAGDGAYLNVTLPKRLAGGVNYTVTVYRRLVSIEAVEYGREFEWKYITGDVYGAQGGLDVAPGVVEVENVNGTIYLTSH